MIDTLKYLAGNLAVVILIVLITQTMFFIVYSYLVCGDPFLALKNFYNLTYGWEVFR